MNRNAILPIVRSGQSVFRTSDLALLWKIQEGDYLKNKIHRLVKAGTLMRLRPGLFVWSQDYDPFLVANKLVFPSYVSLQTILAETGAIFQYDSCIYSIAQYTAERTVGSRYYVYRKLRDEIFFQKKGVVVKNNTTRATPERAFLDWLYLNPSASVDYWAALNREACLELVPLYQNSSLEKRLKQCFKDKDTKPS